MRYVYSTVVSLIEDRCTKQFSYQGFTDYSDHLKPFALVTPSLTRVAFAAMGV